MLTVFKNADKVDWKNMRLSEMMLGNAYDTEFTYRLHKILTEQKKKDYHSKAYDKIMKRAIPIFAEIGIKGVRVDRDRLEKVKLNLERDTQVLKDKLLKNYPGLNLNSNIQVLSVLFTDEFEYLVQYQELKKYKNGKEKLVNRERKIKAKGFDLTPDKEHITKTDLPSTDKEALIAYTWECKHGKRPNPEAAQWLEDLKEYKRLDKLLSSFVYSVERALENTGQENVYFKYKLDGTVTGRLSCSTLSRGNKKTDKMGVSFHTLPREKDELYNIRDSFVVDDYETQDFIAADYSTMELRILAHCSQDPAMMEAFQEGKDLHTFTASLVFNKTMEAVTPEERSISKTINFLKIYGGGITKLMQSCGLTKEQAKFIDTKHKQIYCKAYDWMDSMDSYIKTHKRAVSLFGRSRRLPDVASRKSNIVHSCLRKGKNSIIQSTASDILVCVTIELYDFIRKYNIPNTRILANVHDSIEVAVDKRISDPFIKEMKKIMEKPSILSEFGLSMSVPLEVDIERGTSFGDVEKVLI